MNGALDGIKVLEAGAFFQVSSAACVLGDLGADVVKVESRMGGDPGRGWIDLMRPAGQRIERNYLFEFCNRNKRSVALDLQTAGGRIVPNRQQVLNARDRRGHVAGRRHGRVVENDAREFRAESIDQCLDTLHPFDLPAGKTTARPGKLPKPIVIDVLGMVGRLDESNTKPRFVTIDNPL